MNDHQVETLRLLSVVTERSSINGNPGSTPRALDMDPSFMEWLLRHGPIPWVSVAVPAEVAQKTYSKKVALFVPGLC